MQNEIYSCFHSSDRLIPYEPPKWDTMELLLLLFVFKLTILVCRIGIFLMEGPHLGIKI